MSRLLPALTLLVVVTDAVLLATGTIGATAAVALFLAVELPLGAVTVAHYVRRYRAFHENADPREARRALIERAPLLRLVTIEARTLSSLARALARRPDIPDGTAPIGYARGTLGIPVAMAMACVLEIVAIHVLVPWPGVRIALDVLGLYGLVWVLGMLAARVVNPHLVGADSVTLRHGTHLCGTVPRVAIVAVRRERRLTPTTPEVDDDESALCLPGPDGANLRVDLDRPVTVTVPAWPWSRPTPTAVTRLWLHVDDPAAAAELLSSAERLPR